MNIYIKNNINILSSSGSLMGLRAPPQNIKRSLIF